MISFIQFQFYLRKKFFLEVVLFLNTEISQGSWKLTAEVPWGQVPHLFFYIKIVTAALCVTPA